MSDYFINHRNINAYTINAFAEAIVEATKQGLALNFDSARRIGSSFSISIVDNSTGETQVEAEETPAVEAQGSEAQPADESSEEGPDVSDGPEFEGYEERTGDTAGVIEDVRESFTVEDIEAAADSMELLKQLGDPVGVSARSKREMVKQLKEYIGA